MDIFKNERLTKVLSILAFIFIILALTIIAVTPSAAGYEISIYDVYPWYFWFLIIGVFVLTISVTLYQVFYKNVNCNLILIWIPALMMYFILFLLPFFRGYPSYGRGDVFTHIGYINNILSTGTTVGNGYPISHILITELSYATSVNIRLFVITISAFFAILYILFVNRLANAFFNERSLILLVTLFALFLKIVRVQEFAPFHISSFFVPLFLYLLYKRKENTSYSVLFIILIILLPFFHIFVSLILVVFLIILWQSDAIWGKISKIKTRFLDYNPNPRGAKIRYQPVILLMGITTVVWIIYSYITSIREVLSWVLDSAKGEAIIAQQLSILQLADLNISQFIYLVWVSMSNPLFFYAFPFVLFTLFIISSIKWKIKMRINKTLFQYAFIFLFFIVLSVFFMFAKDLFSYARLYVFVVISSMIVCSILICDLINYLSQKKKKIAKTTFFIALFFIMSLLMATTILTVHRSPIDIQANGQVSMMEYSGMKWNFANLNKAEKLELRTNTINPSRFKDAIYNTSSPAPFRYSWDVIPDEFGYASNDTIAHSFNVSNKDMKIFMIFTTLDKEYYKIFFEDLWERAKSYSDGNVERLYNDYTADNLYCNGEFTVWLIQHRLWGHDEI